MSDRAPHNGTETSRDAAESIGPHAGSLRSMILGFIRKAENGATCDEVEAALSMSHQTASARIRELMQKKLIYHDGQRKTRSGRMARIYFESKPKGV